MNIKTYLIGRAESLTAWIGFIGFILEIVLHLGTASTIMLLLFAALVVLPEARFQELFRDWTKRLKDATGN